jgi:hypothetical protein
MVEHKRSWYPLLRRALFSIKKLANELLALGTRHLISG